MTDGGNVQGPDYGMSAEEAFLRRRAELDAIPKGELKRVNLDPMGVVAVLLAAEPRIHSLRPEFESSLIDLDFDLVDGLRDYTLALYHTNTTFLATAVPVRCPPEFLKEAKLARKRVLNFLNACAHRELVDAGSWKQLRGAKGYLNVGTDLGLLVSIALATPAVLEFEDLLPPGELKRGELIARELLAISATQDVRTEALSGVRNSRARAFTKALLSYRECRRGVAYVRAAHGDAEDFAPSLSSKRLPTRSRRTRPKLHPAKTHVFCDPSGN